MIKRILVALDPDSDTEVAIRHAAEIARRHAAEVTGLAVVNVDYPSEGGGIGSLYYQEKLREHATEESREVARALIGKFEDVIRDMDVQFRTLTQEGVPFERIIEDMRYYDLLIVGRHAHFFYSRPNRETDTLEHVVRETAAPALIVDTEYRPIQRVVVAFDGKPAAARSMQRFAQLQLFGAESPVDVVHIYDEDPAASEWIVNRAKEYLEAHGFRVEASSLSGGDPDEQINRFAGERRADLIVAGAHFGSRIRQFAFGSTTVALLKHAPASLFLEG
ncbi:MAG TPA: universal stress protein [Rhodothermales bacterium]|nr:universal stress protein [Rhodothermales bacterium]